MTVNADARADTVISYLPDEAADRPTGLVQAVPLTAPVARQSNGIFLDEVPGGTHRIGGRLRNLMDLLLEAPTQTMDVILDPALRRRDHRHGSRVRGPESATLAEGDAARARTGEFAAEQWIEDLQTVRLNQHVYLLPWANPDASALAAQDLCKGPLDERRRRQASTHAATATARRSSTPRSTVSRPGAGLSAAAAAGANLHVLAQESLTQLTPTMTTVIPRPSCRSLPAAARSASWFRAPTSAAVEFPSDLSALDYRQYVMAETTVRALSSTQSPVTVIAAPQNWNPGPANDFDLAPITRPPDVLPQSLLETSEGDDPQPYDGSGLDHRQATGPDSQVWLPPSANCARTAGCTSISSPTPPRPTTPTSDRSRMSGSSTWQFQPERGQALVRRAGRDYAAKTESVTITVPTSSRCRAHRGGSRSR